MKSQVFIYLDSCVDSNVKLLGLDPVAFTSNTGSFLRRRRGRGFKLVTILCGCRSCVDFNLQHLERCSSLTQADVLSVYFPLLCVFQAVSWLDASPPIDPVVSLSAGLFTHELLLRCQTDCRGRPSDPQPQTGGASRTLFPVFYLLITRLTLHKPWKILGKILAAELPFIRSYKVFCRYFVLNLPVYEAIIIIVITACCQRNTETK